MNLDSWVVVTYRSSGCLFMKVHDLNKGCFFCV
jgi:hypothetical protein